MSKNKIEDLIKIAQEQNSTADKLLGVESEGIDEAAKFIMATGIKQGICRVPVRSIYEFYSEWAREPINKIEFMRQFAKYFQQDKTNTYRYYKLNMRAWDLYCKVQTINETIYGNKKKQD